MTETAEPVAASGAPAPAKLFTYYLWLARGTICGFIAVDLLALYLGSQALLGMRRIPQLMPADPESWLQEQAVAGIAAAVISIIVHAAFVRPKSVRARYPAGDAGYRQALNFLAGMTIVAAFIPQYLLWPALVTAVTSDSLSFVRAFAFAAIAGSALHFPPVARWHRALASWEPVDRAPS